MYGYDICCWISESIQYAKEKYCESDFSIGEFPVIQWNGHVNSSAVIYF